MLDHFLEIAYQGEQQRSVRNEMAEGLKHLPVEELKKIASGEIKLSGYDDDDWLCKFKGTPMYDDALALETECLELDAESQKMNLEDNAERRERTARREEIWDAKDAVRLKKRLLELELRKAELSAMGGGEEEPMQEVGEAPEMEAPPEMQEPEEDLGDEVPEMEEEPEEKDAAAYFVARQRDEVMAKFASSFLKQAVPVPKAEGVFRRGLELLKGTRRGAIGEAGQSAVMDASTAAANIPGATTGSVISAAQKAGTPYQDELADEARKVLMARTGAGALGLGTLGGGATLAASRGGNQQPGTAKVSAVSPEMLAELRFQGCLEKSKDTTKQASMPEAMQVADYWGRRMAYAEVDKEAGLGQVMGTAWQGLRGAGSTVRNLASRGATAYQKGGMEGLQKAMTRGGKQAIQSAGRFAVDNPLAAGAIGAGALGTAGLVGAGTGAAAT